MIPRVTLIVGAGRSGSTLLERLLASAPDAKALGEAHCLWRIPLSMMTCSCGATVSECPFWFETRARAGFSNHRLLELAALERSIIRHGRIAAAGFFASRYRRDRRVQKFRSMQRDLFAAAAETAGVSAIIDNSKAAPRAWALSETPGVSIVRLTRPMGDVAASWARRKDDPALGGPMRRKAKIDAAAEWTRAEISARILAAQTPVKALTYRKLIENPMPAMRDLIGERAAELAWAGERRFIPDPDYHAINGNPDRFLKGPIHIRPSPSYSDQPQREALA